MSQSINRFYIYQLRLEGDIEPFYIGKGTKKRAWLHLQPANLVHKPGTNYSKIKKIRDAYQLGIGVIVEILVDSLTQDDAFSLEISLIEKYGRLFNNTGCLCNIHPGGAGGHDLKEEAKAKKLAAFSATFGSKSQEDRSNWIARVSKGMKEFYSDPVRSAELREKHAKAHKGVKKKISSVEKMKATKAKQFADPDYAESIRIARTASLKKWYKNGGVNPFKGKKLSISSIEKMKITKALAFSDPEKSARIRKNMSNAQKRSFEKRREKLLLVDV